MDKDTAYNIASRYISYLKENKYDVVKAVLFGSYAKGDFNNDSDIDIAVIFKNLEDKFNTQVKLFMLTPKFDTRIEPHPIDINDYNHNNPFAYEIIKNGIEI
ncbi:MAG: nucleotidyltransferase domain-containing protein [Ignavibacteriae bacterium]|nr:nucleotidyltransferase domain-containing protein [Ignavibacteriota bacterium]